MKIDYITDISAISKNPRQIRFLDLSSKGLTELPEEVFSCTNLLVLKCDQNHLTDLPDTIANLASLQVLDLRNNHFTQFPQVIFQLTNLQELGLGNNQLSYVPAKLCDLQNLKFLHLSHNLLSQLPHDLYHLQSLQKLSVAGNRLYALPEYFFELKLQSLDVSHNYLPEEQINFLKNFLPLKQTKKLAHQSKGLYENPKDFLSIAKFSQVLAIDFSQTPLEEIPEEIFLCSELKYLNLSYQEISYEDLIRISQLTTLETLILNQCSLTKIPESLKNLQSLTYLSFAKNSIKTLPASIGQLQRLQKLDLYSNQIQQLPDTLTNLQGLRHLNARNNRLLYLPQNIHQLADINYLNLSDNPIRELPEKLSQWHSTMIFLNNTKNISDTEIIRIASERQKTFFPYIDDVYVGCEIQKYCGQTAIEEGNKNPQEVYYLDLSCSELTDFPTEILSFSNLFHLDLSNNQISQIPEEISELKNLRTLILQNNPISSLPSTLGQLENLQDLIISQAQFTQVPEVIVSLHNLRLLSIEHCQLKTLPESLSQLEQLSHLELGGNQILFDESVTKTLQKLKHLRVLFLNENELQQWPEVIFSLKNLEELYLDNNPLHSLSEKILQLKKLQVLSLIGCDIENIGHFTAKKKCMLPALEVLLLDFNHLTEIPELLIKICRISHLSLNQNQITTVEKRLKEMIFLEKLELADNPLTILPIHELPTKLTFLNIERTQLAKEEEQLQKIQARMPDLKIETGLTASNEDSIDDIDSLLAEFQADTIHTDEDGIQKANFNYLNSSAMIERTGVFIEDISKETVEKLRDDPEYLSYVYTFSENLTTDDIASFLDLIPEIERVDLSSDIRIWPVIQDIEDLQFLQQHTALKELYIKKTRLSSLAPLSKLTRLEVLVLGQIITADGDKNQKALLNLTPLQNLANLKTLAGEWMQLSGMAAISSQQLLTIDLQNCHLDSLAFCQQQKQLTYLNLQSCDGIEDFSTIGRCTALRYLNIARLETEHGWQHLQALEDLETLILSHSPLTSIHFLSSLQKLKHLKMDFVRNISDISILSQLPSLKSLDISYNNRIQKLSALAELNQLEELVLIELEGVDDYSPIASLTNLKKLNLYANPCNHLDFLIDLVNLEELDLENSAITDIQPLSGKLQLEKLNLNSTQINDLSPLATCSNLKELYLSSTEITDLTLLQSLTNLTTLFLDHNNYQEIPTGLKGMTDLQCLYLQNNYLTEDSFSILASAIPECYIYGKDNQKDPSLPDEPEPILSQDSINDLLADL